MQVTRAMLGKHRKFLWEKRDRYGKIGLYYLSDYLGEMRYVEKN